MNGTIIELFVDGTLKVTKVTGKPTLEKLKAGIGGGHIELVPMFNSYEFEGELVDCVAFCDEEGKLKSMPINRQATLLWHRALRRARHPGLVAQSGNLVDVLVGTIAVVFGDKRFMEEL